MKRILVILATLAIGFTFAQVSKDRIIEFKGKFKGDLIKGPYNFEGGFTAVVQRLNIVSPKATLSAPAGLEMGEAEGKRIANFEGDVTVTRGKLTAKGPSLEYKEAAGLGVLSGPANIVQKPEKEGDDVLIAANKVTFDVDNDISVSEGNVKLINGKQSGLAGKVQFDERCNLALFSDDKQVTLVREPKKQGENKLSITAKEARSLTDSKLLIATGGVTLVSGDNTTTGASLYYDDEKSIAYVVGDEAKKIAAKNINKKNGATISSMTIENNTRKNQVKQLGGTYKIPAEKFKFPCAKP